VSVQTLLKPIPMGMGGSLNSLHTPAGRVLAPVQRRQAQLSLSRCPTLEISGARVRAPALE